MSLAGETIGVRGQSARAFHPAPAVAVQSQFQGEETGAAAGYDRRLFVTPVPACQRLLDRIQAWAGPVGPDPGRSQGRLAKTGLPRPSSAGNVLRLAGEQGAGKTWLLRHLAEDGEQPAAVYLDLGQRKGSAKPEEYASAVQRQIDLRCPGGGALLLLDSVPAHLDDHLRVLESEVLRPHLSERGAMVVLALSHPSRDVWRAPMLRGGEVLWLQPFGLSQTRSQLQRLEEMGQARAYLNAAAVQDLTGGLPLLNDLLARWGQDLAFERFLDYILSRLPLEDRARVRSYLEAVSVLDSLDHASIYGAWRVYHRARPQSQANSSSAVQIRNLLRGYWLARSCPEMPGRIVLVDSVRRAAREVLQARDPYLYAAMNEAIPSVRGGAR